MSGKTFSLNECKIQAAILLKNLQSSDSKISQMAVSKAQQLLEHTSFNDLKLNECKLKHCLQAIAIEYGFSSWNGLKFYFTTTVNTQLPTRGGFLHKWFATYKEAKANFSAMNEFLFPYKNHFFIATASYVEYLGINITNPDWVCIRNNWVEPEDTEAWKRLSWHLNKKVEAHHG